jgi:hypothetical protein
VRTEGSRPDVVDLQRASEVVLVLVPSLFTQSAGAACRCASLDGTVVVSDGEQRVADHPPRWASEGWGTVPVHHRGLWGAQLSTGTRCVKAIAPR